MQYISFEYGTESLMAISQFTMLRGIHTCQTCGLDGVGFHCDKCLTNTCLTCDCRCYVASDEELMKERAKAVMRNSGDANVA